MDTVTLRPFSLADADVMMTWASDPVVTAFMTWEPYTSREPLLAFIRDTLCVVVARAHWGKGVATAALKQAVAAVFGDLDGVERIEALVDAENAASQRALEKAGFTREAVLRSYCVVKGRLRDMVVYSFISTDPLVE
ncbi:hypothetical protein QOZ80_3BG0257970 [Eleusine coracana subsp. coracana]|nr:hypothetical protein QOZ80_3BG0257970 [Eleusine coracana subsp. coracana]